MEMPGIVTQIPGKVQIAAGAYACTGRCVSGEAAARSYRIIRETGEPKSLASVDAASRPLMSLAP